MPRMVPRVVKTYTVVRLRQEVVAERGQYLVVDEQTEDVEILTAQQVRDRFHDEVPRPAPHVTERVRSSPATPPSTQFVEFEGKRLRIGGQLARLVTALPNAGPKFSSGDLRGLVPETDAPQISARLTDASRLGFVESLGVGSRNTIVWQLTNSGRFVARELTRGGGGG